LETGSYAGGNDGYLQPNPFISWNFCHWFGVTPKLALTNHPIMLRRFSPNSYNGNRHVFLVLVTGDKEGTASP
jgi:hypothetical protein